MKHCPFCSWPMRLLEPNHLVRCLYSKSVIASDERDLRRKVERSIVPAEVA